MPLSPDALRRFQEELAALDHPKPALTREQQLLIARTEFLDLQRRYDLSVADVIGFFPADEGIEYLRQLIDTPVPKRRRKSQPTPG